MQSEHPMNRRGFLKTVGAGLAAGGLVTGRHPKAQAASEVTYSLFTGKTITHKAVGIGMVKGDAPIMAKFKLLKELGYDGVEWTGARPSNLDEVVAARDATGLIVHGLVNPVGWSKPLTHPDPAIRKQGREGLMTAIRDAHHYGASSVLVVPGLVDVNIPYDVGYVNAQAELRKVIHLAEDLGIDLLIENVWNNFLLSPLEMARFIDELDSPRVRSYFDVGNIVRMGWPEQWIRILGKRIAKIHVKEYSRKKQKNEGLWKGFNVKLGEGDCNWPVVMKALREIGYSGWATGEVPGGDRDRLADVAARMDRILER